MLHDIEDGGDNVKGMRFFFSANVETSIWILSHCEKMGLKPSEFLRTQMHKLMKADSLKRKEKSRKKGK